MKFLRFCLLVLATIEVDRDCLYGQSDTLILVAEFDKDTMIYVKTGTLVIRRHIPFDIGEEYRLVLPDPKDWVSYDTFNVEVDSLCITYTQRGRKDILRIDSIGREGNICHTSALDWFIADGIHGKIKYLGALPNWNGELGKCHFFEHSVDYRHEHGRTNYYKVVGIDASMGLPIWAIRLDRNTGKYSTGFRPLKE